VPALRRLAALDLENRKKSEARLAVGCGNESMMIDEGLCLLKIG
jgi:hypothetical protein